VSPFNVVSFATVTVACCASTNFNISATEVLSTFSKFIICFVIPITSPLKIVIPDTYKLDNNEVSLLKILFPETYKLDINETLSLKIVIPDTYKLDNNEVSLLKILFPETYKLDINETLSFKIV
jgi:hypothetical protein